MSSKSIQSTVITVGLTFAVAASGTANAASPTALPHAKDLEGTASKSHVKPLNAAHASRRAKPRQRLSLGRPGGLKASAATSARPATGFVACPD